jgi:hypothetical protein
VNLQLIGENQNLLQFNPYTIRRRVRAGHTFKVDLCFTSPEQEGVYDFEFAVVGEHGDVEGEILKLKIKVIADPNDKEENLTNALVNNTLIKCLQNFRYPQDLSQPVPNRCQRSSGASKGQRKASTSSNLSSVSS